MGISERIKTARALLEECRARQHGLLRAAATDGSGRTLSYVESDEYDLLEIEAKALERELVMLSEQRELEAAMAKAPRSNADE